MVKYYCNRRTPTRIVEKNNDKTVEMSNAEIIKTFAEEEQRMFDDNKNDDEVVLPPGCDHSMFKELGKRVITYGENVTDTDIDSSNAQGGLVTQCSGLENTEECYYMMQNGQRPVYADNLSGSFDVMSVPTNEAPIRSMSEYLRKYKGKFLCLDLWTSDMKRMEKCGVLLETGNDFVVIQTEMHGELMMIDLKTIRYISIYCR